MRRRLPNNSDTRSNKLDKYKETKTRFGRTFLSRMPSLSKKEKSTHGAGAGAASAAATIHHDQSLGMTQRRGTPLPLETTLAVASSSSNDIHSNTSPKSPIIPMISDFMFHDDEYGKAQQRKQTKLKSLLSSTSTSSSSSPTPTFSSSSPTKTSVYHSYQQDTSYNPQCCAKFCTFFSFIAILFLVTVGILIEVQPLYIKGISPERIPISFREMREKQERMGLINVNDESDYRGDENSNKRERELLSYVNYSGRLRMLQSYYIHQPSSKRRKQSSPSDTVNTSYDDDPITKYTKYNDYLRTLSEEQKQYTIYEMKSEAKVSFKAAALYFVIMVLCTIYTHNTERVHLMVVGLSLNLLWMRLKLFIFGGGLRRLFTSAYHSYKRRGYSDIPEKSGYQGLVVGMGRSSGNGGDNGSGSGSGSESMTKKRASIGMDYNVSHDVSYENLTGLSMKDVNSTSTGVHFGQQEQQHTLRNLSGEMDDDKPKKR